MCQSKSVDHSRDSDAPNENDSLDKHYPRGCLITKD